MKLDGLLSGAEVLCDDLLRHRVGRAPVVAVSRTGRRR